MKSNPRKLFDLLLGERLINNIRASIKNKKLFDRLKYFISIKQLSLYTFKTTQNIVNLFNM